ncbi:MAG: signal peptidase I [Candidatus Njordarchaeales archaeon]
MKKMIKMNIRDLLQVIIIFLIILIILNLNSISREILNTDIPYAHIISGSMRPTYYEGDLVIIKGVDPSKISVGDVIVFKNPKNPSELILHRVFAIRIVNDTHFFLTKGDNPRTNPYPDYWGWVPEYYVVGKVIFRIPILGLIFEVLSTIVVRVLLIVLLGIMLILDIIYGEKKIIQTPKCMKILHRNSLLAIILILSLIFGQLYAVSQPASSSFYVELETKPYLYKYTPGLVLVIPLHIVSKGYGVVSIREVIISLRNSFLNITLASTRWTIPYNFHGEKTVSIALYLGNNTPINETLIATKLELVFRVILYDFLGNLYSIIEVHHSLTATMHFRTLRFLNNRLPYLFLNHSRHKYS